MCKKKKLRLKTICLTVFVITSVLKVNAQENQVGGFDLKDKYVSGFLSYKPQVGDSEVSGYDFSVSPVLGFFVSKHMSLEALLIYSSTVSKTYYSDSESTTKGLGIGTNYYFTPQERFSFTIGVQVFYEKWESELDGREADTIRTQNCIITPGISYFLSDSFLLKASLGSINYFSSKTDNYDEEVNEALDVNLNLSNVRIGIGYRF